MKTMNLFEQSTEQEERYPSEVLRGVTERLSSALRWDGDINFSTTKDFERNEETLSFYEKLPFSRSTFVSTVVYDSEPDTIVVTDIHVAYRGMGYFLEVVHALLPLLGRAGLKRLHFLSSCSDIEEGQEPFGGIRQSDGSWVISL